MWVRAGRGGKSADLDNIKNVIIIKSANVDKGGAG